MVRLAYDVQAGPPRMSNQMFPLSRVVSPIKLAAVIGGALLASKQLRRLGPKMALDDRVVVITGASRGLGLALARELAGQGCRLALCARDPEELDRASKSVELLGAEVAAFPCDVSDRQQVERLIEQATARFGQIDVLINNAGLISVGPIEHQTVEDFERALGVMFWGVVWATLSVLPQMRARRAGRIVTITSIGGKISVPHLLPYSAAKFAAVGFSQGLRAELAKDGVQVLTVVPGLMRTGGHLNAEFKGQHRAEFGWFSLGASLPITSIAAEDAARQIVGALQRGEAEVTLGWQAAAAGRIHGLMPGLTADVLGLINRFLPGPGGIGARRASGFASGSAVTESPLEDLGRQSARDLNQL